MPVARTRIVATAQPASRDVARVWLGVLLLVALGPVPGCGGTPPVSPASPTTFTVMTFNAGTNPDLPHDREPDDGYTATQAELVDRYYHNSLSWLPAERALAAFLRRTRPAVVAFQEIFHDPWCATIPATAVVDELVCTRPRDGSRQVDRLLGPAYATLCLAEKPDVCLGIRTDFARVPGCPGGPCAAGLVTEPPPAACSRRPRYGSVQVELRPPYGTGRIELTVVHAPSGFDAETQACRRVLFARLFAARTTDAALAHLILGDLNTDPVRFAASDPSAAELLAWAATAPTEERPFHFLSPVGAAAPRSYLGIADIDHVLGDRFLRVGPCRYPGRDGSSPVTEAVYWDHVPVLCPLVPRGVDGRGEVGSREPGP